MFFISFKIRVLALDGGSQPKTDTTVVRVNVDRNLNKPVFDPQNYQITIKETLTLGTKVATVAATDEDLRVTFYLSLYVTERLNH